MIVSAPFYWLRCDTCAESSEQGGDYMAWISGEFAVANAEGCGWTVTPDGRHFCVKHAGDSRHEGMRVINRALGRYLPVRVTDSADREKP